MSSTSVCTSARERSIRWALSLVILSLTAGGLAYCARHFNGHPRSLDEAIELAEAGKLDEAAGLLRTVVATNPDHGAANLLLAQVLLKRTETPGETPPSSGSAEEALALLGQVRPNNPRMHTTFQVCRGDALDRLSRLDEAEEAWLEAIRSDPTAPEAGFHLLNLYYLQGREEEARRLALRLYEAEPDPHDRVLLLLELIRPDARPPAPASLVKWFERAVQEHPGELHSSRALGMSLIRAGQIENGTNVLRRVVKTHPERVEAWDALLLGLDESGLIDAMEVEIARVPIEIAGSSTLLKHRARIAQGRKWQDAVDLYREARQAEPYNRVVEYRLSRALRHVGQDAEADRIKERLSRRDIAIQELRQLYDRATNIPRLQLGLQLELCQQIADARERMQLPEEAIAWHRFVLWYQRENEVSLQALKRLGYPNSAPKKTDVR